LCSRCLIATEHQFANRSDILCTLCSVASLKPFHSNAASCPAWQHGKHWWTKIVENIRILPSDAHFKCSHSIHIIRLIRSKGANGDICPSLRGKPSKSPQIERFKWQQTNTMVTLSGASLLNYMMLEIISGKKKY